VGRLLLVALAVLAGITVYGFFSIHPRWYPENAWPLIRFTGIYAVCAMTVLILVPWAFARLCAALFVILTVAVIPWALLAVGLLLLSAWCLGRMLGLTAVLAVLAGLAVYLCAMSIVARLPVNYAWAYVAVLAVPIAIKRRESLQLRLPSLDLEGWGGRAAFAVLIWTLAIHWFGVLKPESGADALSMHLAIPMDIAAHHVLTYEPARWLWAVMPMGADFLWSIVYVLGGEFAAHLLTFAFLILLLALMYELMREWISTPVCLLLLALLASTPLALWVTSTLMVEVPLAAMLLGAVAGVNRRQFYAAALLAGAAIATKFGALVVVGLMLPFAVAMRVPPASAALMLACAAPPYLIAWFKTGNPLFPFLNRQFPSSLLAHDYVVKDLRFLEPFTWHTLYDLIFRTNRYCELSDGTFGFQHLAIIVLALPALLLPGRLAFAAIAAAFTLVILLTEPNARYVFSALPLLYIGLAALLERDLLFRRAAMAFFVLCIAANACVLQSVYFRLYPPFTSAQRAKWIDEAVPIRSVINRFNREHLGQPILLAEDSFHAGLLGDIYENHWHQAGVRAEILRSADARDVHRLLDRWRVQYVIERRRKAGEHSLPIPLHTLLANCGVPEYVMREFFLARLESGCEGPTLPRAVPRPGVTAGQGTYDDFSPYILYRGDWSHDDIFPKSFAATSSYSDQPGSVLAFAFYGSEVDLTFSRAPNRGIAAVSIDGVERHPLDEYAAAVKWQDHDGYPLSDGGPHLLVIRCTGQSRPEATGQYIEIDAIDVKP